MLSILFLLFISLTSYAKQSQRYLSPVFSDVVRTANVEFAKKFNPTSGKNEVLRMRVFEPKNDNLPLRPLVILTPGGGFVEHGEDWMDDFGEILAKSGFVVAINAYRLSDSISTTEKFVTAIMKAVSDQRSVMDYFITDAKNENRFRVDLDKVFVGGHSAGGLTSMFNVYHDESDGLDKVYINAYKEYIGKPKVHEERAKKLNVRGVINLSACIPDLNFIDAGEAPIVILHGMEDNVVTAEETSYCSGAKAIERRTKHVGVVSDVHLIEGADHNYPADSARCTECIPLIQRFMLNRLN